MISHIKSFLQDGRPIAYGATLLLAGFLVSQLDSPMPGTIGICQIASGILIILGGLFLLPLFRLAFDEVFFKRSFILVVALILIAWAFGVANQNSLNNMMRDIIPTSFLLLTPLIIILLASQYRSASFRSVICVALVLSGIFSVSIFYYGIFDFFSSPSDFLSRVAEALPKHSESISPPRNSEPINILPSTFNHLLLRIADPVTLFSAVFLSTYGIHLIIKSWKTVFNGFICLALGLFVASGFMIIGLRSATAIFCASLLIICLLNIKRIGLYTRILPLIVFTLIISWKLVMQVTSLLYAKQIAVGGNGKIQELDSILELLRSDFLNLIFGIGWGGVFINPIYHSETRFTHSIFTYFLLKSGIVGVTILFIIICLTASYVIRVRKVSSDYLINPIILISCIGPLLVGVFFQPSYKIMSYGIVLGLFLVNFMSTDRSDRLSTPVFLHSQ